jgi:hypothetical protein
MLAFTARFEDTTSAARGTSTTPFALWAGHRGRGFSKASFRMDFAFAVTQLTVPITDGVTIKAALSGHTARPTG